MLSKEQVDCKDFLFDKVVKFLKLNIKITPLYVDNYINSAYTLCCMVNAFVDINYEEFVGKCCLFIDEIFSDISSGEFSELSSIKDITTKLLKNNFINEPTPLDFVWDLILKIDQSDVDIITTCRLLLMNSLTNKDLYKYNYSTIGASLFLITCSYYDKVYNIPINILQDIESIEVCQKEINKKIDCDMSSVVIDKLFLQKFNISISKPHQTPNITPMSFGKMVKHAPILGEGSFGEVKKIIVDNNIYAVKIFGDTESLLKELAMISKLLHPNISTPIFFNQRKKYIAYKYADGSLDKYLSGIKKMGSTLPNNLIQSYTFQLSKAIEYCHSKRICHLDIKPANILIYSDGGLQLTDFGSSMFIHHNYQESNALENTTFIYASPESLNDDEEHDPFMIDMWSLGCVIYEMFTLEQLVAQKLYSYDHCKFKDTLKNRVLELKNTGLQIDKDAQDLIFGLLELDITKRMKISDVFDNNFLKSFAPIAYRRFKYN